MSGRRRREVFWGATVAGRERAPAAAAPERSGAAPAGRGAGVAGRAARGAGRHRRRGFAPVSVPGDGVAPAAGARGAGVVGGVPVAGGVEVAPSTAWASPGLASGSSPSLPGWSPSPWPGVAPGAAGAPVATACGCCPDAAAAPAAPAAVPAPTAVAGAAPAWPLAAPGLAPACAAAVCGWPGLALHGRRGRGPAGGLAHALLELGGALGRTAGPFAEALDLARLGEVQERQHGQAEHGSRARVAAIVLDEVEELIHGGSRSASLGGRPYGRRLAEIREL